MIREKRNKGYGHGSIESKIQNSAEEELAQVQVAFEKNPSSVSSATWSSSQHLASRACAHSYPQIRAYTSR